MAMFILQDLGVHMLQGHSTGKGEHCGKCKGAKRAQVHVQRRKNEGMRKCWHNKALSTSHMYRMTAVGGLGCGSKAIAESVATQ